MEVPVVIDLRWCKRCGICHAFCPTGVFELAEDGVPVVARPQACTSCRTCEILCPDFAVRVTGESPMKMGHPEATPCGGALPEKGLPPEGGGLLG